MKGVCKLTVTLVNSALHDLEAVKISTSDTWFHDNTHVNNNKPKPATMTGIISSVFHLA